MNTEIESMLQLAVEHLLNETECDPAELVAALREFADLIQEDIDSGAYN